MGGFARARVWRVVVLALALLAGVALPAPAASSAAAGADVAPPDPQRLGASDDPVVAAVEISRATFGDGAARHVLVGRDDVFADSLAGPCWRAAPDPCCTRAGGPGRSARPEMLADVARALGPPQGCRSEQRVFLLGGTQAVSADVAAAVARDGYCIHRFAGASRVETASQIAEWVTRDRPPARVLLAPLHWAGSYDALHLLSALLLVPAVALIARHRYYRTLEQCSTVVLLGLSTVWMAIGWAAGAV